MVAHNMHLRRPPPSSNSIPPTGLKIWSDELLQGASAAPDSSISSSIDGKLPWREKQRRVVIGKDGEPVYNIGYFLTLAAGAWGVMLLLFLLWWRPHLGMTGGAIGLSFFVGILLSYVYFHNLKRKEQYQQVVRTVWFWLSQSQQVASPADVLPQHQH